MPKSFLSVTAFLFVLSQVLTKFLQSPVFIQMYPGVFAITHGDFGTVNDLPFEAVAVAVLAQGPTQDLQRRLCWFFDSLNNNLRLKGPLYCFLRLPKQ